MKALTVKELMDQLKDMPQDAIIAVQDHEYGINSVDHIYQTTAKLYAKVLFDEDHYQGELVKVVVID